jgi:RNA polymerase subunit RPABC4/transcription elongation factor Spt4
MLFRPPEYLEDVRERELEMRAMEEQLAETDLHCPVCRAAVKESFLVCPVCTTKLKQACETCKQPLEPLWQVCPYCETRVATPAPIEFAPTTTSRSRRRRSAPADAPPQQQTASGFARISVRSTAIPAAESTYALDSRRRLRRGCSIETVAPSLSIDVSQ